MSEKLNREELPEATQKMLEEILSTDVEVLSADQAAFLRARSQYLTKRELETYSAVMSAPVVDDKEPGNVNVGEDEGEFAELSFSELRDLLKGKGYKVGMKRAEMVALAKTL